MITFKCACGQTVRVSKRYAGRTGKCPACGEQVRIPGGDPQPTMPSVIPANPNGVCPANPPLDGPSGDGLEGLKSVAGKTQPYDPSSIVSTSASHPIASHNRGAIICGCVLLATIFIPWMMNDSESLMSWDLFEWPFDIGSYLIVAWAIGLAAIVLGCTLTDPSASISFGVLGLVGMISCVVFWHAQFRAEQLPISQPITFGLTSIPFSVFLVLGLIITTSLRLRHGHMLANTITQSIIAGGLTIMVVISIIRFCNFAAEIPGKMASHLIPLILAACLLLIGCILVLVDASSRKRTTKAMASWGLFLVYAGISIGAVFCVYYPLLMEIKPGPALFIMNLMFIVGSISHLFCSGTSHSLSLLITALSSPRPADAKSSPTPIPAISGPPVSANDRLCQLEEMRSGGMLTEEEYAEIRKRILGQL